MKVVGIRREESSPLLYRMMLQSFQLGFLYHVFILSTICHMFDGNAHFSENNEFMNDSQWKFKDVPIQMNGEQYAIEERFASYGRTVEQRTGLVEDANEKIIRNSYDDFMRKILSERRDIILHNENELYEEMRHLIRMRRAYNLTITEMIDGCLPQNVTVHPPLAAEDCLLIGTTCAKMHDYTGAIEWLQGCAVNEFVTNIIQNPTLKVLAMSALFAGNTLLASNTIRQILLKDWSDRTLIDLDLKVSSELGHLTDWQSSHVESHRACAGDYDKVVAQSQNLKCRYNYHNSPFLVIAPLKEEILSVDPKVSMFREVLYDSEIESLKAEASTRFRTASTSHPNGIRRIDPRYRPSQVAFLPNTTINYRNLQDRLLDMTSLSLKFSELFQMLHYAPGGFYRVHGDFLSNLNDVPLGGNTVFPYLRLNVQPVKGSALYWIDMRVNGSEETKTRHAACPVVYGEKIACTKWFRINGQEHWIAEPEDDVGTSCCTNPNVMCRKRRKSIA